MTREEAIEILIAVSVCDRPILSCDFCARYVGMGTDCTYPSDKEIEESVLFLKGASNDAAISALQQQDVTDKYVGEMTNADRIRAMTDEELIGFLMKVQDAAINRFAKFELPNYNALADWLQMPAEDDHDERKENEHV